MKISERITGMASSPIRKLTPLADKAKSKGIRIYHLNIGQPDIKTPARGLDSLRHIDRTVLEYSPSQGFLSLRQKISEYYAGYGMDYSPDDITVTTGASEAVLFSFLTCMDPGDELITTEPTYANYLAFADVAGVKVRTLKTHIENDFALPEVEHFEELITDRTKNTVDLMGFSASDSYYLSVDDSVNYDGTEYTVTGISDNAFKDCTTLSMLFFGKNLLRIGNNAFDGCTRVSEMTANSLMPPSVGTDGFKGISRDIPLHTPVESVMYYQMNAPWNEFTNLQGNPFFVDGLEYIIVDHDMQTVSMISDTKLPQILDIPDVITYKGTDYTVVSIRDGAISDSYGITEIYVPNTVTYIGDKVCGYSSDLRILFLGSGLETIGATAFEYCQNIAEITSLASVPPVLGNYVFGEVKRTTPIYVPANAIEAYRAADIWKEFNLMPYQPSSFSSANMRCLVTGTDSDTGTVELSGYDSEPEGAVEIPESIDYYGTDYTVTAIGEGAYEGCSELTEVSIPASVTTIGNHAFSNCSALTNVTIGNDVVNARNNMPAGSAVSGTDSGNALIHIGDGAFARCSALAQMTVTAVVPPTVGTDAFDEVSRSIPVYVPENALADYRAAEVWKEFTNLKPYTTSSVSELTMPESIRVYGGMLRNPEAHHFIVYDLTGRIIYSGNATTLSLTPGIYVVSCNGANGKAVF